MAKNKNREANSTQFKEAFNRLVTNIEFLNTDQQNRVITITSSVMGEGKSTVISNMAAAMAAKNIKVLLVDGDLRRPMIHKIFRVTNKKGLTNTLQGGEWDTYIIDTAVNGLDILTSGTKPPNPVSFLGSSQMKLFLEKAKRLYDVILIDAPPVLIVPDVLALSKYVDSLLLVVRSDRSKLPEIVQARDELKKIEAPLEGVIFNDYAPKMSGVYKYVYSSGYHYAYNYNYEEVKETEHDDKEVI